MTVRDRCPGCGTQQSKKNGHIHNGKQNHRCKACGRQFVLYTENRVIAEEHRRLVERLLREKISLHGICRAVGVGIKWLMHFMGKCFTAAPAHLHVQPMSSPPAVTLHRLEAEADEMCSFVGKKTNKQWIWLAMDTSTRQVMTLLVNARWPISNAKGVRVTKDMGSVPLAFGRCVSACFSSRF